MPENVNAAVYSFVMRWHEREKTAPSVADVAEGVKVGTLAVAQAVGELNWVFLMGAMSDPVNCFVELDGE